MDMVKVGPATGQGQIGSIWDEKGQGEVVQIFVSYNHNTICTLQFLFYDENGKSVLSNRHGVGGGVNFKSVVFDYPSEFLTSITGSFRSSRNGNSSILSSIAFGTNKSSYGPFGTIFPADHAKDFDFQIGKYPSFGGFHGSISMHGIESIGLYMKPIPTSMINSKNSQVQKMQMAEMRMSRWIRGHTRSDRIMNELGDKVEVASVVDKMKKERLRRSEKLDIVGLRGGRGRWKNYWREMITQNMAISYLPRTWPKIAEHGGRG